MLYGILYNIFQTVMKKVSPVIFIFFRGKYVTNNSNSITCRIFQNNVEFQTVIKILKFDFFLTSAGKKYSTVNKTHFRICKEKKHQFEREIFRVISKQFLPETRVARGIPLERGMAVSWSASSRWSHREESLRSVATVKIAHRDR